jgi:uncharacterized protein (DUF1697 family)
MPAYAAFLRAVNLGPARKISSADLRAVFEEAGFAGAQTFRTSGNVVFEAGRESQAKLTARIEQGLTRVVGDTVTIFLRSAAEVRALAAHQPFPRKVVDASQGKLQVVLLAKPPAAAARKQVLALAGDDDQLVFGDRELFWLPSGGIRDSGLNFKAIEKLLGTNTIRTMGTIEQLAAKFFT